MNDATRPAPRHTRTLTRLALSLLFGFFVFNLLMISQVRTQIALGYGDFASFYTGGKIVLSGQSARLYDPRLQWEIQQQFASQVTIRKGPLPYIRPPFEALIFLPFALFSYPTACLIWFGLKLALLVGTMYVLPLPSGRSVGEVSFVPLLCALAFFPVGFDLVQGQDSILLLFIMAAALNMLSKGREVSGGLLLAVGLFKFHIIIPFVFVWALKRRWRMLSAFTAAGIFLFLVSLGMVHWQGVWEYPRYLLRLNQFTSFGMINPASMPTFRGMLSLLSRDGPLSSIMQVTLVAIVLLGIWVASRLRATDSAGSIVFSFSSALVVVLVTSYYANSYDLTLLLIPLLSLGEQIYKAKESSWPRSMFLVSGALLFCTPLLWLLATKANQFCWVALLLIALAASLFGSQRILFGGSLSASSQQ